MAYGPTPGPSREVGALGARLYPLPTAPPHSAARIASSDGFSSSRIVLTLAFECERTKANAAADDDDAAHKEGHVGTASEPPRLLGMPAALVDVLRDTFNEELERGQTYPQQGPLGAAEFASYFVAYDVIVGLLVSLPSDSPHPAPTPEGRPIDLDDALRLLGVAAPTPPPKRAAVPAAAAAAATPSVEDLDRGGPAAYLARLGSLARRDWEERLGFAYYVKPNYPHRSSHLCNAGFLVPYPRRGLGLGRLAGLTFLHYAPRCGYRGSVFNLVYANNAASLRIWDDLGFQRVGRLPGAGRLRSASGVGDGGGGGAEEYVDAWIIHGDFAKIGRP